MNCFQKFLIKIASFFFPCKIYGVENIPNGKAVLVCNHFSFVDPLFFKVMSKEESYILAKKELFENKFVSKLLKGFGGIPVDRDNPGISTIVQVTRALKDDKKVFIFPEGSRNKAGKGEPMQLKGGCSIFAIKSKAPIVPMAMIKKAKLFSRTKILIGKPFYLDEYYDVKPTPEQIDKIGDDIRNKMIELQSRLKELTTKKKK